MTRRTKSVLLDAVSLICFVSLMSWRLTGIVVHEWFAILLLGLLVTHLLIHAEWIAVKVRGLKEGGWRRARSASWLNAMLFLAMGTTIISGLVISKVVLPNSLSAGVYLNWHFLHERASLATVAILGLHIALNWDLVLATVRRRRSDGSTHETVQDSLAPALVRTTPKRIGWLLVTVLSLTAVLVSVEALIPPTAMVHLQTPDGRIMEVTPPPDLARVQPGSERPDPRRGGRKLALQALALAVVVVAGRKVFRLRLA